MQIVDEIILHDFKPWAGATAVFNRLTIKELDKLEEYLKNSGHIYSRTEINNIFWLGDERICEILDINYEKFWKREAR